MKTFHDVYLGLCLVCWFTSLRDFFIWENVYVMSIFSITLAVLFSKQVLRRLAGRGSSSESECSWNNAKKNNCKWSFFSMCFIQNNKEIHFSFIKGEKYQTQALRSMYDDSKIVGFTYFSVLAYCYIFAIKTYHVVFVS